MSTPASERAKLFVDQCAAIVLGAIQQYGGVASRVAGEVDRGDFGAKEWFRSMTQLWDIAAINSTALATTVAAGPGAQTAPKSVTSAVTTAVQSQPRREFCTSLRTSNCVAARPVSPATWSASSPPAGTMRSRTRSVGCPPNSKLSRLRSCLEGRPGGTYIGTVAVRGHTADPDPKDPRVTVPVIW